MSAKDILNDWKRDLAKRYNAPQGTSIADFCSEKTLLELVEKAFAKGAIEQREKDRAEMEKAYSRLVFLTTEDKIPANDFPGMHDEENHWRGKLKAIRTQGTDCKEGLTGTEQSDGQPGGEGVKKLEYNGIPVIIDPDHVGPPVFLVRRSEEVYEMHPSHPAKKEGEKKE